MGGVQILTLPVIFVLATLGLYSTATYGSGLLHDDNMPAAVSAADDYHLIPPITVAFDVDSVANFTMRLRDFKQNHQLYLLVLFSYGYLFQQAFALPGWFVMNLISGALFGAVCGFALISVLVAVGSILSYKLFGMVSCDLWTQLLPSHFEDLKKRVEQQEVDQLFCVLLSLRLIPMSPSWVLNIVSPSLNIPLRLHVASTVIGLIPFNFLCAQGGAVISDLHSWYDVFSTSVLINLLLMSIVPLVAATGLKMTVDNQSARKNKNALLSTEPV